MHINYKGFIDERTEPELKEICRIQYESHLESLSKLQEEDLFAAWMIPKSYFLQMKEKENNDPYHITKWI